MQRRAAIWILGAFKTSPLEVIEALAGLIPIKFHLQKIARRSLIRSFKLPTNHILKNLENDNPLQMKVISSHNIRSLSNRQRTLTKGHIINSNIKSHGIFPSFSSLDPKFSPGHQIVDIFSNHFTFNLVNKKEKNHNKTRDQELDEVTLRCSSEHYTALVITDASIKDDIATSILHIHSFNRLIIKTVHHASFVTSTEAELFTIRCGINQACAINNVSKIVVVTDSIHAAKRIFDCDAHPYQVHSVAILNELWSFFSAHKSNSIKFWECPSKLRWKLHSEVDKDSKSFLISPSYPTKIS